MNPATPASADTVGIIAGNGLLPVEIANQLEASGKRVFVLRIAGEASQDLLRYPSKEVSFGQLGAVYATLRQEGISRIIFAGGVHRRPDFSALQLDWQTVKTLPKILALMASGDNTLLSGVVSIFEKEGFSVLGVHDVAAEILAGSGVLAGRKPAKRIRSDIALGWRACRQLGALDAGQAAIVENGRIIALEAAEGTDAMLARIVELRALARISKPKTGGVLVKTRKPGQNPYMDLPTIGPQTIAEAHRAGLSGIAVEAHHTVLLDRQNTLKTARELGLFVLGTAGEADD